MDASRIRQGSIPGNRTRDGKVPAPILIPGRADLPSQRRPTNTLRTRPSDLLLRQHASPPAPLRDPSRDAEASTRSSKMSLFNLFSKPKVERLRGYHEDGGDARSTSVSAGRAPSKQDDVLSRVQDACCEPPRSRSQPPRSRSLKSSTSFRTESPAPPMPPPYNASRETRPSAVDLVPLFQAYPQATKYGTLEVTPLTPEMIMQISKSQIPSELSLSRSRSSEDMKSGGEGKHLAKKPSFIRHAANLSISKAELPRKLFVLVTSGALLQYAEEGAHDRLPEKVLQLGTDSAAFACDLIPGKHHVLQVLHAVDGNGAMVAPSASLLSKIGIRSQHSRRIASTFLLVLPGPMEMDSWLTSIRKAIEAQGGRRPESPEKQTPTSPDPVELPASTLTKTPSHRYQVKRDPGKVTPIPTPTTTDFPPTPVVKVDGVVVADDALDATPDSALVLPIALPTPPTDDSNVAAEKNLSEQAIGETHNLQPPQTSSLGDEDETATLDGIEMEASQILVEEEDAARDRAASDAPSASSSTAFSLDQQPLERLRGSIRVSHNSTAPTSRASSMTSSPPMTDLAPTSPVPASQDTAQFKRPFRAASSYALNRRSMINGPPPLEQAPLWHYSTSANSVTGQYGLAIDAAMDSPTVGRAPSGLPAPSQYKRLSLAQSSPNLRTMAETFPQRNNIPPLPSHPVSEQMQAPSVLSDTESTIPMTQPSRSSRAQDIQTAPLSSYAPTSPERWTPPRTAPPRKSGRYYAREAPDTSPLAVADTQVVNPAAITITPQTEKPATRIETEDVISPVPAVHTLTAKVDFATRTTISSTNIPPRKSSSPPNSSPSSSPPRQAPLRASPPHLLTFNEGEVAAESDAQSPALLPSPHLAMFPSPPVPQGTLPSPAKDFTRRAASPPSAASGPQQAHAVAVGTSLRRPMSLMVKSDHAPFLSSVRNSYMGSSPTSAPSIRSGTTVPIRSLKPSRNSIIGQPSSAGRDSPTSIISHHTGPGIIPLTLSRPASRTTMSSSPPPIYRPTHSSISMHSASESINSSIDEISDIATPLRLSTSPPPMHYPLTLQHTRRDSSFPPPPSQLPSRPSSRQTYHRGPRKPSLSTFPSGSVSNLPELDFGIPIVGLGPPAPPPSAPLPDLPRASSSAKSRSTSPPLPLRLSHLTAMNGIDTAMIYHHPPSPISRTSVSQAPPAPAPSRQPLSHRDHDRPTHSASFSDSSASSCVSSSTTSSRHSHIDRVTLPVLSPQSSHSSSVAPAPPSGLGILAA